MLANGCLSGRCRWDSDCKPRWDGSLVTFWRPTWCVTLWLLGAVSLLLSFLALSDIRRDVSRTVSVTIHNALRYWLRQSWAKLRSKAYAVTISHIQRLKWSDGGRPSGRWAQLGNKYRVCTGKTERPSRATKFDMIHYCLVVRMGRHRCYTGTTHEIAVPQQPKAKYKHQSRFLTTNYAQQSVRTPGHWLLKAASNHSAT